MTREETFEQYGAIHHRVMAGRESEQAGHADEFERLCSSASGS
jgi:hypothetical protein